MDRQSILYRTLWLFGIAFAAALLVIAGLIWLTMRRGAADAEERRRRCGGSGVNGTAFTRRNGETEMNGV